MPLASRLRGITGGSVVAAAALLAPGDPASATSLRDSIVVTNGARGLALVDPATRRVRALPRFSRPQGGFGLQRTADGRFLFDTSTSPAGASVLRYAIASGAITRVGPIPGPTEVQGGTAVSPDGRQVAIMTSTAFTTPRGGSEGPVHVDLLDLADRSATPLIPPIPAIFRPVEGTAHNPEWYVSVRWSPDGRQVGLMHRHRWMLTGAPAGDRPSQRLELATPGGAVRVAVEDVVVDTSFGWSPDGRRVAVVTKAGLQLVDVATGARRTVTRGRNVYQPTFSPTGRRLAWYTASGGRGATALQVRVLASGRHLKPKVPGGVGSFSWSRRGERLAVCTGGRGLTLVDARGKVRRVGSRRLCNPLWATNPGTG
jgi:hypothetical protein